MEDSKQEEQPPTSVETQKQPQEAELATRSDSNLEYQRSGSSLSAATPSSIVLGSSMRNRSGVRKDRRANPTGDRPPSEGLAAVGVTSTTTTTSSISSRGSGNGSLSPSGSQARSASPRLGNGTSSNHGVEDENMRELSLKVLLIGPRLVGKTTIVHRITKGKFEPNLATTVGVDFGTHHWVYHKHPCGESVRVKAEFFDIMGQDRTPIIQRYIAKGTRAVLAVTSYPVTTESLSEISQWIAAFQKALPDYPVPVYLLCNKSDTMSKEQLAAYDRMLHKFVTGQSWLGGDELKEGKRFQVELLKGFSHTSARDGTNIPKAVTGFIETVADLVPEEELRAPEPIPASKYTQQRQIKKQNKCQC